METLLLDAEHSEHRSDDAMNAVSPEQLRLVRCRCSDYFRSLGVRDPEVLSTPSVEKQIDLHGGISRCGEIAVRMPAVLANHPEAIESVEAAVVFFRQDKSLCMNAQPPNNPTRFAGQPLTASQRGIAVELLTTILKAVAVWFPRPVRKHAS